MGAALIHIFPPDGLQQRLSPSPELAEIVMIAALNTASPPPPDLVPPQFGADTTLHVSAKPCHIRPAPGATVGKDGVCFTPSDTHNQLVGQYFLFVLPRSE